MDQIKDKDSLEGIVTSVIYRSEESGYAVLRLDTGSEQESVVVGCIPYAAPYEYLSTQGKWVTHPSHGQQFRAEQLTRRMPEDEESILGYLSSGIIKSIGPSTARKIVARFGKQTLDILEAQPHKLVDIKGITGAKARLIGDIYQRQCGIRRLMEFLLCYGLSPQLAVRLYKNFGREAMVRIRENPYILTQEIFGVSFHEADRLAMGLGLDAGSDTRLDAAVLFEMSYNLNQGHSFIPYGKLCDVTARLLGGNEYEEWTRTVADSVDRLIGNGEIVLEEIEDKQACYLQQIHEAECYVAQRLRDMTNRRLLPPRGITKMVDKLESLVGISYAPEQRRAVLMSARSRIMLLTGGPGTGKTTTVRAMLALFNRIGLKTALAAPTGRAAKRMTELCGEEATTVHRLLDMEYDSSTGNFNFVHDEDDPVDFDAVIIDETSMLDITLIRALLAALPQKCRLVLVGDPDQLPSVGPGNVLADIINSGNVDTVSLSEVFRQAQQSEIIVGAHAINQGEMPDLSHKEGDFFFLQTHSTQQTNQLIVDLCAQRLPSRMDISADKIQVLSPTRGMETGTTALNHLLREKLNPMSQNKKEIKFGQYLFREGDKVMQIRNNYDIIWEKERTGETGMGMFNGDIGVATAIDTNNAQLTVLFDDRIVRYSFDILDQLEPAYAMTVHKAQGSEYDAVILSAFKGTNMLLNRRVLYTAVTRARSLMIIVGDESVVRQMVENNKSNGRYSGLCARLKQN